MVEDKDSFIDKFKDIDHSKEIDDLNKELKKKTYRERKAEEYKKNKPARDSTQLVYAFFFFIFIIGLGVFLMGEFLGGFLTMLFGLTPVFVKVAWNRHMQKQQDN